MVAVSLALWLAALGLYLHKRWQRRQVTDRVDREAIREFGKRVKYIRYLETVEPKDCDRHHKRKRLRGVLTLARLCNQCQIDLKLREQY